MGPTKSKVRAFLRHIPTGQYFASLDKWTYDREEAHDFRIIARALRFAHHTTVANLELVLVFDNPEQATGIPFEKFCLGLAHGRNRKGRA